ncbi:MULTISPECIES: DUF6026 family protein [Pseudomonas syringae group genomosp. 2]|uniref:Amino acid adenylation n=2 Tax=Pseudomonas syringae group genomosp. 2 TaxID=251698 RepID=A0A3M5BQN0_PSESS|nr:MULTISPECIES: DUF6026 family protein [Pseudomonas syringae group genomosp. 2]KPW51026.1 Uncharacterized protein ALO82_01008 [Pseudomonas syringae pv. broussonetiae]KPX32531.1 Uncharacterized protein ALO69_01001 [Pseudomonas ficuserectae]KPX86733.1 Uncharacterized protein ALO63_03440 [Pseudomonas amygdali pv. mori]KWT07027.1 hypothetical protein AL047_20510 [Pseudomonas syringae pv. broussonetiae]RMQ31705.1 hypothetical protein ALQ05_03369 [Pseudomonas amygdali pv. mori]
MGTVLPALAPQTLYVTIRRDELRALKEEREQLQKKVAHLSSMLQQSHLSAPGKMLQA